ncbi:MAG: hypothetical protein HIU93_12155 [Acidobacteria bacterium]|nr:hypothetical protein [Acidobacteriota bacterium]MBW4046129.1 hypothetical protein [Acidobacteriota bacterium]
MSDLSVRNTQASPRRLADSLLRAAGAQGAALLMPPLTGDSTDAGQVGVNAPEFQQLPLAPAVFRAVRATMQEAQQDRYELMISGSAIAAQVTAMQLSSGEALFQMAAGVIVNSALFVIETVSVSEVLGQVYLYRLLLREAQKQLTQL